MAKGRIAVDENICKGCELCVEVCPKSVIQMASERLNSKGYHPAELADPQGECTGCAICSLICPDAAITVFRLVPSEKELEKS